jgi:hypothetical protein
LNAGHGKVEYLPTDPADFEFDGRFGPFDEKALDHLPVLEGQRVRPCGWCAKGNRQEQNPGKNQPSQSGQKVSL